VVSGYIDPIQSWLVAICIIQVFGSEMFSWLLFLGFTLVAVFVNAWWAIGSFILIVWKAHCWFRYNSRPWRRIHFPMMMLFASAIGRENARAAMENREYLVENALSDLIKSVYPQWTLPQIEGFIIAEFTKHENFTDADLIRQYILLKNPKVTQEGIEKVIDFMRQHYNNFDNALKVRMIIAGVIEDKYGPDQRGEYMFEIIMEKAPILAFLENARSLGIYKRIYRNTLNEYRLL
jgi:hypothetical protein